MKTLNELLQFMDEVPCGERNIATWNAKRQESKESFPKELINALDASGHITKWLKGGKS